MCSIVFFATVPYKILVVAVAEFRKHREEVMVGMVKVKRIATEEERSL